MLVLSNGKAKIKQNLVILCSPVLYMWILCFCNRLYPFHMAGDLRQCLYIPGHTYPASFFLDPEDVTNLRDRLPMIWTWASGAKTACKKAYVHLDYSSFNPLSILFLYSPMISRHTVKNYKLHTTYMRTSQTDTKLWVHLFFIHVHIWKRNTNTKACTWTAI